MNFAEEVILGLDLAVMKMKKGERSIITIAAPYAYGPEEKVLGNGTVPPNSTLEVDLKLESFIKVGPAVSNVYLIHWSLEAGPSSVCGTVCGRCVYSTWFVEAGPSLGQCVHNESSINMAPSCVWQHEQAAALLWVPVCEAYSTSTCVDVKPIVKVDATSWATTIRLHDRSQHECMRGGLLCEAPPWAGLLCAHAW